MRLFLFMYMVALQVGIFFSTITICLYDSIPVGIISLGFLCFFIYQSFDLTENYNAHQ